MVESSLSDDLTGAKAGDRDATGRLALRYFNGDGVNENKNLAIELWQRAADQGSPRAMYSLGVCYQNGSAVAQDWATAASWYRKSSDLGHAGAMHWLGYCYETGQGVEQNLEISFGLYRKSAEAGDADGMYALSNAYKDGDGTKPNQFESIRWLRLAADSGHAPSIRSLGVAYQNGRGVERNLATAFELYKRSAEAGDEQGMLNLANAYDWGQGTHRDPASAVKWYQAAANEGNQDALRKIAGFCEIGRRMPRDTTRTLELLKESASKGSGCASFDLGRIRQFGFSGSVDINLAAEDYRNASSLGCSCARAYASLLPRSDNNKCASDDFRTWQASENSSHCITILASALQSAMGLGRPPNRQSSLDNLDRFGRLQLRNCTHRILAEQLKIGALSTESKCLFLSNVAARFVTFDRGDRGAEFIDAIKESKLFSMSETAVLLRSILSISRDRGWNPGFSKWRIFACEAEVAAMGISKQDVIRSQRDIGFRYNRLSKAGVLVPFDYDMSDAPKNEDGIHSLFGISFVQATDKIIDDAHLIGTAEVDQPILLTADDLMVSIALAFASESGPINPSLSLEDVRNAPFDARSSFLRRKEFRPDWLSQTEFGKSLYTADWLMSKDVWTTVSITNPFSEPDMHSASLNELLTREMVYNHTPYATDAGRIMLHLVSVTTRTQREKSLFRAGKIIKWIADIDFKIDGSGINYLASGDEDRRVGENDPDEGAAQNGILLTHRFDLLCTAYPVFKRVKLLFTVARLVQQMREDGYRLSPRLASLVRERVARFASAKSRHDEIIVCW